METPNVVISNLADKVKCLKDYDVMNMVAQTMINGRCNNFNIAVQLISYGPSPWYDGSDVFENYSSLLCYLNQIEQFIEQLKHVIDPFYASYAQKIIKYTEYMLDDISRMQYFYTHPYQEYLEDEDEDEDVSPYDKKENLSDYISRVFYSIDNILKQSEIMHKVLHKTHIDMFTEKVYGKTLIDIQFIKVNLSSFLIE
jgi:hypothetical protein